jgi:outer membrane receptor for ferrienterochelin and colicins
MKPLSTIILCCVSSLAAAQTTIKLRIVDAQSGEPLVGATAMVKGTQVGATADANGIVELRDLPQPPIEIEFSFIGYESYSRTITSFSDLPVLIELAGQETQLDEVVVSATRSSRTIDNTPTRVETIAAEELEEKAVMQPSNIRMALTESTGIQTQQTSATSGSTSIRIQGLDGKYTQMLRDGFPLYSGFASGLSILQIPPLDLKRIEVIKGSASTLYGGGAIAGLINLVTKEPTVKRELLWLVNANQTKALDLSGYYSEKFHRFGVTVYAARNSQVAFDRNHDGFSDIAQYKRYTFNPRVFYYGKSTTISFGFNTSFENRIGGDMKAIEERPDTVHTYFENNKSNRYSSQFKLEKKFPNNSLLTLKNSVGYFSRVIDLSDYTFSGSQTSSYSEINYLLPGERSEWIAGVNLWTDQFRQDHNPTVPLDYQLITGGAFIQNNYTPIGKMTVETGLRFDYNSQRNLFALPRLSLMYRFSKKLTSRLGGGLGYKAPTLFSEEAETRSFRNIDALDLAKAKSERSYGANYDLNYKTSIADVIDISVNQMFFYTRLKDPLILSSSAAADGNYFFYNANGHLSSKGFETNLRVSIDHVTLFAGYTFINAIREFDGAKLFNPLTAKHRINTNLMYEIEGKLRLTYELFYVGRQHLSSGELTRDYWVMGISAERRFRNFSIFVNAENFTDSRQTRFEPLFTGSIQNPQFREIYSPIDGVILNGGFKLML